MLRARAIKDFAGELIKVIADEEALPLPPHVKRTLNHLLYQLERGNQQVITLSTKLITAEKAKELYVETLQPYLVRGYKVRDYIEKFNSLK